MKEASKPNNAFVLLAMVVVLWGVNSVSIKYLTDFFPPLALAPVRMVLASLFLLAVVIRQEGWQRVPQAAWPSIGGIAVFCIFLHQITLTMGLKATSSIHGVLILGLNPLFTTGLAVLFLNERFTWAKGAGIVLGFSGLLLVVAGKSQEGSSLIGDGIMCIATLTFVIGSLFVKQATNYVSPLGVTAYSHSLAAVGLIIVGAAVNEQWMYPGEFGAVPFSILLFSSFMSTAVGAVLWNISIKKIGASTASLFQNAAPLVGIFAAALFLGEELLWQHFSALILVLLGVALGSGLLTLPKLPQ